jgi:NADH-quinone oxidoreductase subunit J
MGIVAIVAGSLGGLFYTTWKNVPPVTTTTVVSTTKTIGEMLMTGYLLPFEIASVILLVALLGAAMISRRERKA